MEHLSHFEIQFTQTFDIATYDATFTTIRQTHTKFQYTKKKMC